MHLGKVTAVFWRCIWFFSVQNIVEKQLLNFRNASVSHNFRNLSPTIMWNNLSLV